MNKKPCTKKHQFAKKQTLWNLKKQTGNEHKINKQETNNSTQIKVNKVYQKLN